MKDNMKDANEERKFSLQLTPAELAKFNELQRTAWDYLAKKMNWGNNLAVLETHNQIVITTAGFCYMRKL